MPAHVLTSGAPSAPWKRWHRGEVDAPDHKGVRAFGVGEADGSRGGSLGEFDLESLIWAGCGC